MAAIRGTMSDRDDDGVTRERDRRVQGGILIAMVVMAAVGVVLAYLQVLAFHGGGGSGTVAPVEYPQSQVEVSVPTSDRSRFVEAIERFVTSQKLKAWSGSLAPIEESTSRFWTLYLGDYGVEMRAEIGKTGQFVITFTDKGRNGAEQMLERAFRTDVVEAGGFRPLP